MRIQVGVRVQRLRDHLEPDEPFFDMAVVDGRPALRGDCDFSSAATIEGWLATFGRAAIDVDLSAVTFFDAAAFRALLAVARETTPTCASSRRARSSNASSMSPARAHASSTAQPSSATAHCDEPPRPLSKRLLVTARGSGVDEFVHDFAVFIRGEWHNRCCGPPPARRRRISSRVRGHGNRRRDNARAERGDSAATCPATKIAAGLVRDLRVVAASVSLAVAVSRGRWGDRARATPAAA